ncbi:MAG: SGNH/GDSL hydrolase family protein [Anaerolineales bacterium]
MNPAHSPASFLIRVVVKALLLFLAIDLLVAVVNPLPLLGRVSVYNVLVPGRLRLPYGEKPDRAYNLSLFQLDSLLASQAVNRPKAADEYRVLLVGDSSVWGFLLPAQQALAAQLDAAGLKTAGVRRVRVYNLGYPILSLTKDLLLMSRLDGVQADLIVWLVTLESFPADKQLFAPLVQHNPEATRALITQYQLRLNPADPQFVDASFWDKTLIGRRRDLADWLRLQLYGVLWAATGIDQDIPASYTPRSEDLAADASFHGLQPPYLAEGDLALDVLAAGIAEAGPAKVLVVNEPMFVSHGQNSDIRYNFFYPRWAYDDYRQLLSSQADARGWHYADLWEAVDNGQFTDSPIHLTAEGTGQLAGRLSAPILALANAGP